MSVQIKFDKQDLRNFKRAMKTHPQRVKRHGMQMMTRIKAALQQQIIRNPWQIGGTGGGAPVDTGSLRDSHRYQPSATKLRIWIPQAKADRYGLAVHEGTRDMEARPWLDYAVEKEESTVNKLSKNFLERITQGLAD